MDNVSVNAPESSELRILYLTYEWRDGKIPVPNGTSYPDQLKKYNPHTWVFVYQNLYRIYGYSGLKKFLRNFVRKQKVNLIICCFSVDFEIHLDFLQELRKSAFMVMYTMDDIHYFDAHTKYLVQCFDLALTHCYYATFKYEEIGVAAKFLPPAFDTSIYYPLNKEKDIDVSFVGVVGNRASRVEYVEYLKANGIDIQLFGPGTPNGFVTRTKMLEVFSRSKINLDFSGITLNTLFTYENAIHKRLRGPKGRPFEIGFCKSFALVEYAPGIEEYMKPEKEIGIFYDKEDLLKKINFYLKSPEVRETIAANAYEKLTKENELSSQVKWLLEYFRGCLKLNEKVLLNRKIGVFYGKDYVENFSTFRVLWFCKFIKEKKWKLALEELVLFAKYRKLNLVQAAFYITQVFPETRKVIDWGKNYFFRLKH